MNSNGNSKLNRRKRRLENERRHKLMRQEFDAKAIRRRAHHQRDAADEFIKAMKDPSKFQDFISKIENK